MLIYDRQTKPGLVALYDTGQEMEQVHSYNPGAHMGQIPVQDC